MSPCAETRSLVPSKVALAVSVDSASHVLFCCHVQSVCLSVCLSIYLSTCLSVCLSLCLSVSLSLCLSDRLSVGLSVGLSFGLSVCLSVHPSIYLSIHPSIYLASAGMRTRIPEDIPRSPIAEAALQERPRPIETLATGSYKHAPLYFLADRLMVSMRRHVGRLEGYLGGCRA